MKKIGIIPNLIKDENLEMTKKVIGWFETHGFQIIITPNIGDALDRLDIVADEEELYAESDTIVVLGGDGTLLGVAPKAAVEGVPVIGINLGRLGFLTDIEKDTAINSFEKLVNDSYYIEERMMLEVRVISNKGDVSTFIALNDLSITRDSYSRMVDYSIHINNQYVDTYPADGIIVATPTGSTGYSLSAGGPIIDPKSNIMVITPICPHTIYSRSIIVCDKDSVEIKVPDLQGASVGLSIDGKNIYHIAPDDIVRICKSKYTVKLIKLSEYNFYDILRTKIVERRPSKI